MAKCFNVLGISLRIIAIMSCLISASVMFTSKETTVVYGITMNAKYSLTPAFKFCAFANVIAAALSLVALLCDVIFFNRKESTDISYYLFLHDLVVMSLLLAASAAAIAIGYLGEHGNEHAGWLSICEHFHAFCHRVTIAIAFSFLSFLFFFFLTIINAAKSKQIPVDNF